MILIKTYKLLHKNSLHIFMVMFACLLIQPWQPLNGQENQDLNKIVLIGQVINNQNGGPVLFHEVFISSDTVTDPQSNYFSKLHTDQDGLFNDIIYTDLEKGALLISTYDHLNNRYDTVVYFRFTWEDENLFFPNFIVCVEFIPDLYQANFFAVRNPEGSNEMLFRFHDLTNAEEIISWFWDFGDGANSSQQHPVHVYEDYGVFRITLTVEIEDPKPKHSITTQMVKMIHVTNKDYYHFGGHVFAGYFPIDHGEAFLYKVQGGMLMPIDTAYFNDALGHYFFYQLIEGEYIAKADLAPNSVLFDKFMTTYYSNKLHWNNADTVFHYSTSFDYHINLVPNIQQMSGIGSISGKITYAYGSQNGLPASNMSIFLYDLNNNPVSFCHSDDEGLFYLNNLTMGSYLLYAEVTGKYTIPLQVTISESNYQISQIEFTIETAMVYGSIFYAGINNTDVPHGIGQPYPNPANDFISLDVVAGGEGFINWSLMDNSGRMISTGSTSNSPGENTITTDISNLAPGLYFIGVHAKDGRIFSRKFIK